MARVATLGTAIESAGAKKGADEVKGALDQITQAATKTTAAMQQSSRATTQSLTEELRAVARVETERNRAANEARRRAQQEAADAARRAVQRRQEQEAAERARRALEAETQAMGRAEAAAYQLDAAFNKKAAGALASEKGMDRLRSSATMLLPSLTGINMAAGMLVSTLGSLAAGSSVTLGIVAGVATISAVYTALTADAKRLREENQKAVASLREIAGTGRATSLNDAVRKARQEELALTRQLTEAEAALRRAQSGAGFAGAKTGLVDPSYAAEVTRLQKQIADTQRAIADGRRELGRVLADTAQDYSRAQTQALADLVRSGNATVAEQTRLRDRLRNLQGQLTQATAGGEDPAKRAELVAHIQIITDVYEAQAQAAKKAADARTKATRELEKEEKTLQAILDSRMGYRQQANTGTLERPLGLGDAKDVDRYVETMTKARVAVRASIATRQEDIDSMKQQLEAMKEGEAAVRRLTVARAQERAVAEAYAKLPEGGTLGIGEEDTIRKQVAEWYQLNFEIENASRKTREWYDSLRDVAGVVQLITAGLGERNVAQAANGAQSLFSGIQRANSLTDKAGNAVSFGTALSGGAGLSGFLGAAGGAGAIVGGIVQIGQALDLFGERAREEARVLRERAKTFNTALAEFGQGERTALGGALQTNLNNALQLARGSGYTGGGFFASADIDAAARETFRKAFDDLKNVNKEMLLLSDQLTRLADAVRKNEAVITERLAFEERLARGELDTRKLRAQGADEEAAALARQLAGQKEVRDAVGRFGADSAYVAHLKEVLAIEEAAAQAMALRTAEQRAFDTRMGNAGLTARLLGAQGDPMADELRAYIQAEQELRDAREKGLDIALLVAAQEAERMQRRVQQEQEAQQKQLGYAAREAALTNSINAQLIQKAAQWQAELNALSPTDTAGRERVNTLNQAEWERMRAGFRSQADSLMGGYAMGAESNNVTRAVMQATLDRANAEKQLTEYLNAGIVSQQEYADTLENVNIATRRAVEEAKAQQNRDRLGFEADLARRVSNLNPMDRGAAKSAYDMAGRAEFQAALDNALKLKEAGAITNDLFTQFVRVLTQEFSPAVRDSAWALQEAARIVGQTLSALSQQWTVFGTDAAGQEKDLLKLFGFEGMTPDQIKGLFTKVTPGQELSPTQMATNNNVYTWFMANQRAEQVAKDELRRQQEAQARLSAMPSWNPGRAADIPVLGGESVTMRSAASMTETSATRLIDFASAQLSVQRRILQILEGKQAAGRDELLGPAFVDRLDRAFGTRAADSDLLLNGRVS